MAVYSNIKKNTKLGTVLKNLNIVHWNCNGLVGKKEQFATYLELEKPHVVSLNEIKMNEQNANKVFNFSGYTAEFSCRKKRGGGGVALLIRNDIEYKIAKLDSLLEIAEFGNFELELVSVSIKFNNKETIIISYYNPPQTTLNYRVFEQLSKKACDFILCGDLNAKSNQIGCHNNTSTASGKVVEKIFSELNVCLVNDDASPTYRKVIKDEVYTELLDLIICSYSLYSKVKSSMVFQNKFLVSDHLPLEIEIETRTASLPVLNSAAGKYDFNKANWELFKTELINKAKTHSSAILGANDINVINRFVVKSISEAATSSIPVKTQKDYTLKLPREVLKLIEKRDLLRTQVYNYKQVQFKSEFNSISKKIDKEIERIRTEQWQKFMSKLPKNHTSSLPYWREINKYRKKKVNSTYPTLEYNSNKYENDEQKAHLFGQILGEVFTNTQETNEFHSKIINNNKKFFEQKKSELEGKKEEKVSIAELWQIIKKLNRNSAAGEDAIHNIMLVNLPNAFMVIVAHLVNVSLKLNVLADDWKRSLVTMIPKKDGYTNDPLNYRPISVTSCIGKLTERVIKEKLVNFLESKNLLVDQQSGFRRNRSTQDNLFFLTQKSTEALARGKKCLAIFFDIAKAFDKVWYDGLYNKMIKMNIPSNLICWTRDYLTNRKFTIKVNNSFSEQKNIESGVPQGGVLSPILFSIFINDVPLNNNKNRSYSLLFADDLVNMNIFTKPGQIQALIKSYLIKIEIWLSNWRLSMSANKCSYIIFSNSNKYELGFKLLLFNKEIPYEKNPRFLGITFDERLTFKQHIENIKTKCQSRLNIIKIISHRSWKIRKDTIVATYYALVRSIIDYMAFCFGCVCKSNLLQLQIIQNSAIRSIFKPPFRTNLIELAKKHEIVEIHDRLLLLFDKYIRKNVINKNPLVMQTCKEYILGFESRSELKVTPICHMKIFLVLNKDLFGLDNVTQKRACLTFLFLSYFNINFSMKLFYFYIYYLSIIYSLIASFILIKKNIVKK